MHRHENASMSLALTGAVALALGTSGCTDGLTDINADPNTPTDVPGAYLLAPAIEGAVGQVNGTGLNLDLGSILTQHLAKVYTTGPDRYEHRFFLGKADGAWPQFYHRLENLRLIREAARESGDVNEEAIVTLLMAWNFHVMTDLWGDVPYFEALRGRADEENLTPSYDPQETIYEDLIAQLDAATSLIDVSETAFGQNDILYNGDMTKWLKFGNSLKLRLFMRLSEVSPATARDGIARVYADGNFFASHDDAAGFHYRAFPNNHPTNGTMRNRDDFRMSKVLVDTLLALADPRLRVYATPTQDFDDFRGVPNGQPDAHDYQLSENSQLGAVFMAPATPAYLMRYTEVRFILAEAAARGWIAADAEAMYEEAIRASMAEYTQARIEPVLSSLLGDRVYSFQSLEAEDFPAGITTTEAEGYLAQPPIQFDPANWREQLGFQRWVALFGQGLEAWMSWKRLDEPSLEVPELAVLDNIPLRLPYPTLERSLNQSNYSDAVSRQGADDLLTHVWWDVK